MSLLLLLNPTTWGEPAEPSAEVAIGPALPALEDLDITLTPPGGSPRRLTPLLDTMRWTTAARGGYGSFSSHLPGWWTKRELPYLSTITVALGPTVLWEGRLEDWEPGISDGDVATEISGFGRHRILDDESVQRLWVKTDWEWQARDVWQTGPLFDAAVGAFDEDDLTRVGVRIAGRVGQAVVSGDRRDVRLWELPGSEVYYRRILATVTLGSGANAKATITWQERADGGNSTATDITVSGDYAWDVDVGQGAQYLTLSYEMTGADTLDANHYVELESIRILGAIPEDTTDGEVYGGNVLRDLINQLPGLTLGQIDTGDDFAIGQIERVQRGKARGVVDEVASYYDREFAVWDDGRCDWLLPALDEIQWVIRTDQLKELKLTGSVDQLARTTIVIFPDATQEGRPNERSFESTSSRNPYVRTGLVKDDLVQANFPMTPTSAARLAERLNGDSGERPPITGRLVLHADTVIHHATAGPQPAWLLRAGQNLKVPDLPTDELIFADDRDGETMFHIVTTDVDLAQGLVTLELEGQSRRGEILLARLADATRILTS